MNENRRIFSNGSRLVNAVFVAGFHWENIRIFCGMPLRGRTVGNAVHAARDLRK